MANLPSLTDLKDTFINTISRNKEILTGVVTGASETTRTVINATNNEQWGPTGPQMRTIADLTFNYSDCTQVMEAIWERLETDITFGANWRNIYKTLLLLDYIIRNGSERVVNEARQNSYQIKSLSAVHFVDSDGIDRGLSIRERAKHVTELLSDTGRLREERKKCKQNRDKYSTAYGNESYERPYNRHSHNTTFEEEDFSSRRTNSHKVSFNNLTEDDFKDDDDYRTSPGKNQSFQQEDEEFPPFPATRPKLSPPTTTNPPKPNPVNHPPATTHNAAAPPVAWDPFSPAPTPSTNDNWDDFNPRGPPTQSPNLFEPITPAIPTPVNPNPVGPSIPLTSNGSNNNTLPPNLFNPIPSNPPVGSNPQPKLNLNQVTPKSNDPWAASHLFNLSNNPSSPRSANSVNSGTAKPLGATVGTGWPNATPISGTTAPTMPTVTYAYPPNVAYPGVPYTYPVATNTPTLYTTTPVNYSNTSWRV